MTIDEAIIEIVYKWPVWYAEAQQAAQDQQNDLAWHREMTSKIREVLEALEQENYVSVPLQTDHTLTVQRDSDNSLESQLRQTVAQCLQEVAAAWKRSNILSFEQELCDRARELEAKP